ncbi:MAG: hypothetical protein FJ050_01780 [Cyanobacteria bacterium M_surface_7_m2_040]|nr:hypothetical protein [Cyanobacteria bacterium K_Offshore_0m_m2_072]MBM5809692.1 hypothetical protein [Cyanobacteria bacterium M_surface_9_m1_291]MBM5826778.1 hypothetical protein [Cyanobacteria bacterium M_surface_7_m2_040]
MAQATGKDRRVSDRQQDWPSEALDTAVQLQRQLSIGERDWHRLKAQRPRRAAEQLAAALVQLLSGDQPGAPQSTPARQRALELVEHAERWLRAEISDPGCATHRRRANDTTTPEERLTAS